MAGLPGENLARLIRLLSQPHSLLHVSFNAERDFILNAVVNFGHDLILEEQSDSSACGPQYSGDD